MGMNTATIGVYVDADYYGRVFSHYLHRHAAGAPLSLAGLVAHCRSAYARFAGLELGACRVVTSRYICNRGNDSKPGFNANMAERDARRQGFWIQEVSGARVNRTLEVSVAVESLEDTMLRKLDVVILIAGASSYCVLARKLAAAGAAVVVPAFDVSDQSRGGRRERTSPSLLEEVALPLPVGRLIETAGLDDPQVRGLFLRRPQGAESKEKATSASPAVAEPPKPTPSAAKETPAAPEGPLWGTVVDVRGRMGFLREDWNGKKLFFHHSAVKGDLGQLKSGDRVEYDRGLDPRDRPCALNVRTLANADSDAPKDPEPTPEPKTESEPEPEVSPTPDPAPEPTPEPEPTSEPAP